MADDVFTKSLYSAIFSAGVEIARRDMAEDCLHFQPAKAVGNTTGEAMLDAAIRQTCGTNQFGILASFDVLLAKERRLFVCRVQFRDTTGIPHTNTCTVYIEPGDLDCENQDGNRDASGGRAVEVKLTPNQEEIVMKLLDSVNNGSADETS